jgi:hypothetical protein
MPRTNSSPDWFARSIALLAIGLTVIGLYFSYRSFSWQTKTYQEGLEERILMRLGFTRDLKSNEGDTSVEVVNIGMHPMYIRYVEIQVPNGCKIMGVETDPGIASDECGLSIYDHGYKTNQPIKPLEPGEAANYRMKWDFSKFPLQDWMPDASWREHLWVRVETTKKGFRQHPIFSWYEMMETISQEHRKRP